MRTHHRSDGRTIGLCVLAATLTTAAPAQTPTPAVSTTPRVSGYLQPRFQAVGDSAGVPPGAPRATFVLRRARFALDGNINPWASYRVQVEMRTLGAPLVPASSPLSLSATDLYIKLSQGGWGATLGQFRVPFSLESLLSSTTLETTERSRVVNAAKRDIGVQAEWRSPDRVVLQGAVVNGEGPNRGSNPDNRMAYFARAVFTPVKGLDVGGAFEGYTDSTGVDAQAVYRHGRWTGRAEYIREHNRNTDVHATGWYALAGYTVVPDRVQIVGRVEQFDPSDKVATDRETGYLVGVQYFIRGDAFKVVADYEAFREQVVQVKNDRGVVQMQVRW